MSNKREIISEWFFKYNQDVYDFLVYYTGTTDVEDLVQEVFIKASKGLDSFKGDSSPKTWLITIARHLVIDQARIKKNKIWKQRMSFDESIGVAGGDIPEKILLLNEEKQLLYRAIQELRTNYRDVVILRGIKQFSVAETAEILHWKESKVRTNYHRALRALSKREDLI
jgi:RNA polymerase sigma-70 factor, ECF subfamily